MNQDFDAVIVGSGPAGVSAAFPLLDAGLRVLMVDGGKAPRVASPAGQFLDCLLYTSPSPRDQRGSRMPSSA